MMNLRGELQRTPLRYRYLLLITTICGGSVLLINFNKPYELYVQNAAFTTLDSQRNRLDADSFTIRTEGCTIPALNPFDESILKFARSPINIKPCHHANRSLLGNNESHIWIEKRNIEYYHIPADYKISCCYRAFNRPSAIADISAADIDDRVKYATCVYFSNIIEMMDEFIYVTCDYETEPLYSQMFLFVFKKPLPSNRDDIYEPQQNQSAYNVIVIGIDTISRMNFYRTMPKTLAYLKSKGAIELKGYNKVGDNTFPNLIPMLLGINEANLKKTCLPNVRSTFDNCPFIWEWYKEAGFHTAFGEDSASLGTFNYQRNGFSSTPTDYYIHTFMNEAETILGNNKDFNSFLCMGNKYFYQVLLDYIENLAITLRTSKFFGFFWETTMSHDYLNYPILMDKSFLHFFNKLDESRYLDDTIMILLSDHGIRWGDIRSTKQGRLEERLPLVYILLPPLFRQNYSLAYDNIKINSKRLTTPFDIHATLMDLVNLDAISDENIIKRSQTPYTASDSVSLFMEVPVNRTCKTAGIEEHWCTCHRGVRLAVESGTAMEAGGALVSVLNALLHAYVACARLRLAAVLEATELEVGGEGPAEWREFLLVVRTTPGDAVFEATLRHRAEPARWQLAGTVSRLNLYGTQSHCVHNNLIKLYCYCL